MMKTSKIFESSLVRQALKESVVKLNLNIDEEPYLVVEVGMLLSFY